MDNVDVYEAGLDGVLRHRARVLADGTVALSAGGALFHRVVREVADYTRNPGAAHWETDADGLVRRPCEHLMSTDPENSACVIAACGSASGAMAALVVLQNSLAGVAASLLVAVPAGTPTPLRPRVGRTRDVVRAFQRRHPDLALRGWVHACQIDLDGMRWGDLCR